MKSVNVLPRSARSDSADGRNRKSKAARERREINPTTAFAAYQAHIVLRDLRPTMAGPTQNLARVDALRMLVAAESSLSALAVAVARVHGVCPNEQVVRPNAGRVVAMVADGESFRDVAEVEPPGQAMGVLTATRATRAGSHNAVAESIARSLPLPASVALKDLAPKAVLLRGHYLVGPRASDRAEPPAALVTDRARYVGSAALTGVRPSSHTSFYYGGGR